MWVQPWQIGMRPALLTAEFEYLEVNPDGTQVSLEDND